MPNIPVNDSDWNSLPPDAQSQIQSIVSQQLPGATIVPDPSGMGLTQSISPDDASQSLGLSVGADQSCVEGCNAAGAAAAAGCAMLGNPVHIAVCIAVVQIATAICRSQCK
jgi:hypothetical protein